MPITASNLQATEIGKTISANHNTPSKIIFRMCSVETFPATDIEFFDAQIDASEASDAGDAAAERRPAPQLPPPPAAFSRRQPSTDGFSKAKATTNQVGPYVDFIQSARRNVFGEIFAGDVCPVESMSHEESLWAAVEDVFLQ